MTKLATIVVLGPAIETVMVTERKEKQDRMKKALGFSHKAVFSQVLRNHLFSLEKNWSLAKLFRSMEEICVLKQNFSIPLRKLRCLIKMLRSHNKLCSLTKLLPKKLYILLQKFYISPSFAFPLNICALRETLHLLTKALNYRFSSLFPLQKSFADKYISK